MPDHWRDRNIAHRRQSDRGDIVEGVIHGMPIERAVDLGLQDGEVVEMVIRRVKQSRTWGEGGRIGAGSFYGLIL